MLADGEIAEFLRQLDGENLVVVGGLRIAQIRRPEQPERTAGERLDETLRGVQFQRFGLRRRVGQIGVG